jgi:hypothetical protein
MAGPTNTDDPKPFDQPPRDDPILMGEAILERAREVSQWICGRVYDLTHREWPEPRALDAAPPRAGPADTVPPPSPQERARRVIDRTRQTAREAARLIDDFHDVLTESWRLIARSRSALADPQQRDAASRCTGLVPEFSRQPAVALPEVAGPGDGRASGDEAR